MSKSTATMYRDCPECGFPCSMHEYANKNGDLIYSKCVDCRRKYHRSKQAERRSKIKHQAQIEATSKKKMHHDSLLRLRAYLIDQAGSFCQPCGHDHKINLKLINLDGSPLSDVLYLYIDNMNHDTWSAVIEVYQRCILMCANCVGDYNHDEALIAIDDMLWKANPYPKQPE